MLTTVYILKTPKKNKFEYRVKELMAVENYVWDDDFHTYSNDPDVQIRNARDMWTGSKVFTKENEVLEEAAKLSRETCTEYGISFIEIPREF